MQTRLPDPATQPAFYDGVVIKRGIAWVIDFAIISALLVPFVIFSAFTALFILPALFFGVGFVYRVLTIANGSATWGMRAMAIEFRDIDNRRFTPGQALLHTLGFTVLQASGVLQLVSILAMLLTERGQGLTDLLMGSTALNRQALPYA